MPVNSRSNCQTHIIRPPQFATLFPAFDSSFQMTTSPFPGYDHCTLIANSSTLSLGMDASEAFQNNVWSCRSGYPRFHHVQSLHLSFSDICWYRNERHMHKDRLLQTHSQSKLWQVVPRARKSPIKLGFRRRSTCTCGRSI